MTPDDLYNNALSALLGFGVFFVAFLPLERLFAKHKQPVFRKEYLTDLAFFSGQYLLWTSLVVSALTILHENIDALPLQGFRDLVQGQPIVLQLMEGVLLGDFLIYWGHRLSHRIPLLWRFHRVHHTAEKLDWIAAFREHPLDNLFTRTLENLPIILMGVPLEIIAGFVAFRGAWGLYIHSNVRLSVGPLKYFVGSPELHHRHHELESGGHYNFANLMPLMDLLFGTFDDPLRSDSPRTESREYGIPEGISHGYVSQLLSPLLPRTLERKFNSPSSK